MKRLSFITQFKIEFLLLFTDWRRVLGKMAIEKDKVESSRQKVS